MLIAASGGVEAAKNNILVTCTITDNIPAAQEPIFLGLSNVPRVCHSNKFADFFFMIIIFCHFVLAMVLPIIKIITIHCKHTVARPGFRDSN
jgi:hypothetical protein